jgi:hypothetical protein
MSLDGTIIPRCHPGAQELRYIREAVPDANAARLLVADDQPDVLEWIQGFMS